MTNGQDWWHAGVCEGDDSSCLLAATLAQGVTPPSNFSSSYVLNHISRIRCYSA